MDKPISVRRVDLRNKIISNMNEEKLPPFVIAPILEGILAEVNRATELQYKADLARWEETQKKEAEDAQQNVQD